MIKFSKKERSTFYYWFAHWCSFQMTALNLHVWKPKYLLHDIEKPWLMLVWKDYKRVQKFHRKHNNHHIEYADAHGHNELEKRLDKIDIVAMVIDNECSRFTKAEAPLTAIQYGKHKLNNIDEENAYLNELYKSFYQRYLMTAKQLGLEE